MNHETIEEGNVAERYLLGQLDAAEAADFEEHYLDCPECLERLELSRRLRDGLKDVAAEEGSRVARSALLAWLLRRGRGSQALIAAAVLAVMILPWALLAPRVSRLSGELDQALSPRARTFTYSLSPERSGAGEEPSTRISLGSTPEWVTLVLQLPPQQTVDAGTRYRIRLIETDVATPDAKPLWQSRTLAPDPSGRLTLSVHSSWLRAVDYTAAIETVTPDSEPRPLARFSFQVRRNP